MGERKKQAVLAISGYNIRAIIAFCRWATDRQLPFYLVASGEDDPIFLTSYADRVVSTRGSKSLSVQQFRDWYNLLKAKKSCDEVLILPSTEYLNRFLLDNRAELEASNYIIPLAGRELYERISDKYSFVKMCRSNGLDVPDEWDQPPGSFPYVAKPRTYRTKNGKILAPQLIMNFSDHVKFLNQRNSADHFYQEYVEGRSIYLLAYIGRNKAEDRLYSQENLMQQAGGGSILLAAHCDFHHQNLAQRYVSMLRKYGFHGLIMVELRYNPSKEKYYMIEANPRLWGPMQFCVDNRIDLFGSMMRDYDFELPEQSRELSSMQPSNRKFYYWSGGLTADSSPPAYHSYSRDQYEQDLTALHSHDLFNRNDTIKLYLKEAGVRHSYEIYSVA